MKTRPFVIWLVVWAGVGALAGCDEDPVRCPPDKTPPAVPTTLVETIGRTNEFAFDLYHELGSSDENLIVSPHNIVTAFGMAYAGARGTTEREIATVLHFNYPPSNFHSVLRELNDLLESRGASVGPTSFLLNIASSSWGRTGATYLPAYLDTLDAHYDAGIRYVDFVNQPESARLEINEWARDETYGLIEDLIPPGKIDPLTFLVLASTVYFRAEWLMKFDPVYTHSRPFTRLDQSTVNVPFMNGEAGFPYYKGAGFAAIELPYKGEECSMVLVLPDEGRFSEIETALTTAEVDTIVGNLRARTVLVFLPKFSFGTQYDLVETLKNIGMTGAFLPGADFSGIDGTDDGAPWIDFVAHKTFISVDEWGTLAAAGTGIGFTVGDPPRFDAARPFIFLVRDIETGTILFLGRVLDPSA